MAASKFSAAVPKPAKLPKKPVHSSIGAPSQRNQASRKGKRAWRKNVDIEDVEEGLEGLRAEERVTGTILQKTRDADLFQIDIKGDDNIRQSLPRFTSSQLTSSKIVAQRSAVPAILSRPHLAGNQPPRVSRDAKARLLRIARRSNRGPFNSTVDSNELGAGSALLEMSAAVRSNGTYDVWNVREDVEGQEGDYACDGSMSEASSKPRVKAPTLAHPRDVIAVPAITQPHQGTSYNPPAAAHQALLRKAHEAEVRRVHEAARRAEVKAKIDGAQQEAEMGLEGLGPLGMKVGPGDQEGRAAGEAGSEAEDSEDNTEAQKKAPQRKTRAQRNRATRVLAEKRALAARAARKRMLVAIGTAPTLRRSHARLVSAREAERAARQAAEREQLRQRGLAGQRLGKHRVPEGAVDVQLGEELSESLRALKPEGNLFRDRFLSLQQRALIEPRVPVLPRKQRKKVIEYEKHAWKRFE